MGKREPSCTVGGNANWHSHHGEQYGNSLKKKLGIKLSYEPTTPLLGMYPEEIIIEKGTCTPVFTAALFTITRTWKQPRCPLTDEWIKKLWNIYTMDYSVQFSSSVVSDSSRPHGLQPTRLLNPWDFPGKSIGVGCHYLLRCCPVNKFCNTIFLDSVYMC